MSVSLSEISDIEQLKEEWLGLEGLSSCHVFLSWSWISTWLEVMDVAPSILRVCRDGEVVGLGLLSRSQELRHGWLSVSRVHFQLAGSPDKDQIWPEYNDLLIRKGEQANVVRAVTDYLASELLDWQEWLLGPLPEDAADAYCSVRPDLSEREIWQSPVYGVSMDAIRDAGMSYLESLSKNTRYQIKRSFRLCSAQMGSVELYFAENVEQAVGFLDSAGCLHRAKWASTESGSGFDNPLFVDFHCKFLERSWDCGLVDVVKLTSGDVELGYFYLFCYRGRVYFYLSGLMAAPNNKVKPGLMGHSLLVQHYMDKGYAYYDFMAGDDRYKRSLAKAEACMKLVALQRPSWGLKLEGLLRKLKLAVGL